MDLQDFKTYKTYSLTFELSGDPVLSAFKPGWASISQKHGDVFNISQGKLGTTARLEQYRHAGAFFADMANGAFLLMCIIFCIPGKVLQANVTALSGVHYLNGKLKLAFRQVGQEAGAIIEDLTFRDDRGNTCMLMLPARSDEDTPDTGKGFFLVGNYHCLRVRHVEDHGIRYYQATEEKRHGAAARRRNSPGRAFLLVAEPEFVARKDIIRDEVRTELEKRIDAGNSYIDLWNRYAEAAKRLICRRARSFCLPVQVCSAGGGRVSLRWNAAETEVELPSADSAMALYEQKPAWVEQKNTEEAWQALEQDCNKSSALCRGILGRVSGNTTELKVENEFCLSKLVAGSSVFLVEDMNMSVKPLQRSRLAHRSIMDGSCANPFLSSVIDSDSSYRASEPKGGHIPALSPFVNSKLFANRAPTERQRQAIEIALNTPDIALIQGPPGTGKTTVITAILERLNELHDKSESVRGEVLVTSFQHDAVENVISRLTINSLPTIKFGSKITNKAHSEQEVAKSVSEWRKSLATRMERRYSRLATEDAQSAISRLAELYRQSPSRRCALELLEKIRSTPALPLPPAMRESLIAPLYHRLRLQSIGEEKPTEDIRPDIWRLRTTREGFQDGDDGWLNAATLLNRLEELSVEELKEEMDILREAADCYGEPSEELLASLRKVRYTLLQRFSPAPEFTIEKADNQVLQLLDELKNHLVREESVPESPEGVATALYHALRFDPESIREAIESYNFVYAATNQQCVGRDVERAKGVPRRLTSGDGEFNLHPNLFYDTVVVDEAAKSAPPDLMIPMSLARRRIILVGDHRQLPHMIDELVETEMMESTTGEPLTDEDRELCSGKLEESMFSRLKQRLEELERKDGIKRTITLDQQFRTHPTLGKLVSRYFYEPNKEGYESPLGKEHFEHDLPEVKNCSCVWISCGKDGPQRSGTSLCNRQEASRVVHWLKRWMDSDAGKGLTFGVISFYKAQLREISRAMESCSMMQNGAIADSYLYTADSPPGKEGSARTQRLRIGTVDSFQGMEFDVVILSMVRTNNGALSDHPFGFLENANRLCVALSRQKKMLAIAGDERLVESKQCSDREDTVAILSQFYKHCDEEGRVLS